MTVADNPYMDQDELEHYHNNDDLEIFMKAAETALNNAAIDERIIKRARAVVAAIKRYLRHHNDNLNLPIERDHLIPPLQSIAFIANSNHQGNPPELNEGEKMLIEHATYPAIRNMSDALDRCLTSAKQFKKELPGHPIIGALLTLVGITLCLASFALFCASAGILTPVSVMGAAIGSSLIAMAASGGGFVIGSGCVAGGLFLFSRPNRITRTLKKLHHDTSKLMLN